MITARSATLAMEPGTRDVERIRLWSLRENVLVEGDSEHDRLVVVTPWGETRIDAPGELVRESLRRMSLGPISLENVLSIEGSAGELARLREVLELLNDSIVHSLGLRDGDGPLLSAVPIARDAS